MEWLSPGDNAWQMTAATFVGLMSVPGLVVLYGGVMQKRWSVNSMMMAFVAFAIVLIVWVLYGFKMGFGAPIHIFGAERRASSGTSWASPGSILDSSVAAGTGERFPLLAEVGKFVFPQSTLVYFQFVFAAITPILMLGSVLGRINFKAWIPFVLLWIEPDLHGQRVPDLGRRLLRPAGRARLLGRLRDPPRGRGLGIRRCRRSSGRACSATARSTRRTTWRWSRSGPACCGWAGTASTAATRICANADRLRGRPQHQPLHRGRLPGLGRTGLRDRAQAEPDRLASTA